jgi:CDP-diacylglycerol--glycerol-3-phosphate 3-phosphatidyltransferase
MAKIFTVVSKAGMARLLEPIARGLLRLGVSPNAVTVAGTIGVVLTTIVFAARGQLLVAALLVTFFTFADMIDGVMARLRGTGGRFGALLDSTMDRIADGAVFGSLAYWLGVSNQHPAAVAALLCLVSGQVVSYVKARAEGLGLTADVGVIERPERLILVGIGGLLHGLGVPYALAVVLWIVAVGSVYTVGQRMVHVYRQERQPGSGGPGSGGPGSAGPPANGKARRGEARRGEASR